MKALAVVCVLLVGMLLVGCSAYKPPRQYDFEKERVINKPFDDVWGKVIEWFATRGTPIKTIDKSSGLLSTDYNLSFDANASSYTDCGEGGQAALYTQKLENVNGNFNVLIKKVDETSTKITVNTFFSADGNVYNAYNNIVSTSKKNCNSTGVLEKKLIEYASAGEASKPPENWKQP